MEHASIYTNIFMFFMREIIWFFIGYVFGGTGYVVGASLRKGDPCEMLIALAIFGPLQATLSGLGCALCNWWSIKERIIYLGSFNFICFCCAIVVGRFNYTSNKSKNK
jgi:hypothetical protein